MLYPLAWSIVDQAVVSSRVSLSSLLGRRLCIERHGHAHVETKRCAVSSSSSPSVTYKLIGQA